MPLNGKYFVLLSIAGSLAIKMPLEGIAWFLIKSMIEQFSTMGIFLSLINLLDITIFYTFMINHE